MFNGYKKILLIFLCLFCWASSAFAQKHTQSTGRRDTSYIYDMREVNDSTGKAQLYQQHGIFAAIINGDLQAVKIFIALNPESANSFDPVEGLFPTHWAALADKMDILKYLIDEAGANPRIISFQGSLPIHYAALRGDIDMVDYLINHCLLDINVANTKHGATALYYAFYTGNLKMVKYLMKHGASGVSPTADMRAKTFATYLADKLETDPSSDILVMSMLLFQGLWDPAKQRGNLARDLRKIADFIESIEPDIKIQFEPDPNPQ